MRKNILNKIIFMVFLIIFIILLLEVKSNAATSISISTSKSTVSPGETFTVTVSATGAGAVSSSVSNGSGGKTEFLDNSSYSFNCIAGSSGSVTISASGTLGDYETETEAYRSASKTVQIVSNTSSGGTGSSGGTSSGSTSSSGNTGKTNSGNSSSGSSNRATTTEQPKEVEKSSVNTLSGISIEGQTFLPEFDVDVKEYTVNIPNEVTAIEVKATPMDSKATVKVEGNTDLQVGENTITITVTAEDLSTSTYLIKVIRAREALSLKSLLIKYTNQDGELVEIPLNPIFSVNTVEYSIEDLEYWVEKLMVQAEANLQDANIEVQGADKLQTGENIITIVLTIKENLPEGQETKEETITYTIKVNKQAEPTFIEKVKNKIKLIFGGIFNWYDNNLGELVVYALGVCIIALVGLSVYIVIDYKKYKMLIEKIKKLEQINSTETVKENLVQKTIENENNSENEETKDRTKGGKHF